MCVFFLDPLPAGEFLVALGLPVYIMGIWIPLVPELRKSKIHSPPTLRMLALKIPDLNP